MVHADDSFLAAVREIGRPATGTDVPDATQGPTIEELDRAFAAHGITNVGPPMEQAEAERLLGQLAGAAIPTLTVTHPRSQPPARHTRGSPLTGPASSREQHSPSRLPEASPEPATGVEARLADRPGQAPGWSSDVSGLPGSPGSPPGTGISTPYVDEVRVQPTR